MGSHLSHRLQADGFAMPLALATSDTVLFKTRDGVQATFLVGHIKHSAFATIDTGLTSCTFISVYYRYKKSGSSSSKHYFLCFYYTSDFCSLFSGPSADMSLQNKTHGKEKYFRPEPFFQSVPTIPQLRIKDQGHTKLKNISGNNFTFSV